MAEGKQKCNRRVAVGIFIGVCSFKFVLEVLPGSSSHVTNGNELSPYLSHVQSALKGCWRQGKKGKVERKWNTKKMNVG